MNSSQQNDNVLKLT